VLTAVSRFFAVFALYLIGCVGLNEFAIVLLFGFVIGSYSSLFILLVVAGSYAV
jgi:preprotein translocase subunit SecF